MLPVECGEPFVCSQLGGSLTTSELCLLSAQVFLGIPVKLHIVLRCSHRTLDFRVWCQGPHPAFGAAHHNCSRVRGLRGEQAGRGAGGA